MKHVHFLLLFILFGLSCSEPELVLDNELDPGNPDYVPPETSIIYTIPVLDEQGLIVDDNITLFWEGNDEDMEFRYRLDEALWTMWDSTTITSFTYLNEGVHIFIVQGRYPSGVVDKNPDTLAFIVDAVSGPALMFYPRRNFAEQGETVIFQILAEEVIDLMAAEIHLTYDPSLLQIESVIQGSLFQNGQESLFSYDINVQDGTVEILTTLIDNENPSVSGTGVLLEIHVGLLQPANAEISFTGEDIFRDPENNNITILEKINGLVELE